MIKNKKGAEMTIGTIIIIILALVVLVVLIYGFTSGWTNLWDKINIFGGDEVNVQDIVQACQLACTTGAQYDYCTKTSNVVFEEGGDGETLTCVNLQGRGTGLSCDTVSCT